MPVATPPFPNLGLLGLLRVECLAKLPLWTAPAKLGAPLRAPSGTHSTLGMPVTTPFTLWKTGLLDFPTRSQVPGG